MPKFEPGMKSAIVVMFCCAVGAVIIAMVLPTGGAPT